MGWLKLSTLLSEVKRARIDPRRLMVYVPDGDLPAPAPPRYSPISYGLGEAEDDGPDFESGED